MKLLFFRNTISIFSLLLILLATSCQPKQKPVTADEAKIFAQKLESSLERRNPDFMDEAIAKTEFFKKAGLGSGKEARSFGAGLEQSMKMGSAIIKSISKKGTYQLVKQYEKNNAQYALFRLYDDGSLNYHDIELTRSDGNVKIADIYIYTSGEYLSETIKGLFLQMKDLVDKKGTSLQDQWIKKLPEMRKLMNEGKYDEASAIYKSLPADVQKMRAVQIIHVLVNSGLDDNDEYAAAIEEYQKLYPNEPNMHLLLLDGYILKKEYDKALNGVNKMDSMINKDPFLDYYRYLIYNLKEDKVNSKICIERLVKNMPDFEDGMMELIATYIEENNETAAKQWIEKYKQKSSFDQERLATFIDGTGL
ncbi:MAG TPA: hypothetical protein PLX74_09525 [Chitinophagaceae bacterium]|nr:hypothetical protein [Chitinophagaceae bacterium]